MIFLHKILPLLVLPIMAFLGVLLFGLYANKRKVIYCAMVVFYMLSTPFFSNCFFKAVEGDALTNTLDHLPRANAIVVLSGMLRIDALGDSFGVNWIDADRFFGGLALYAAQKAPLIVFTGGKSPYRQSVVSEGAVLKKYALDYGIPSEAIFVTEDVLNTAEEAQAVAKLLGNKRKIILVTSAFHMKRAKGLFEKKGIEVIPHKVDYKTPPKLSANLIDFLPTASALENTETGLRELLGRLYYGLLL
ncbi:MAG: YdcF family protein [Flavobacteriaceae bacterium]